MKNSLIFLTYILLFVPIGVYATNYNYLPNDVFLKQQEEKSALEYRLKTLENQSQSNPQASILSIEQRISELERQRDSEKEYLKGTLAKNGAYSPETWASYSTKIDAKYNPQINSLNQQKSSYQSQSSSQQNSQEISDLKLEIAKLKADMVDQELKRNLGALEKYQVKETPKSDTYYSDDEILKVFNYLDALSLKEASVMYQVILKDNKNVAERVDILYKKKYPNGKTGTAINSDYKKSVQEVAIPEVKKETPVIKTVRPVVKQEIKKAQVKATTTEEKIVPQVKQEQVKQPEKIQEEKPAEIKVTFREKVSGFFKKVFWK